MTRDEVIAAATVTMRRVRSTHELTEHWDEHRAVFEYFAKHFGVGGRVRFDRPFVKKT